MELLALASTKEFRCFNADVVHVMFVLLVYALIQLYLKATHHEEFATQRIETLKQEERSGKDVVIVYAEKWFSHGRLRNCEVKKFQRGKIRERLTF